MCLTLFFNCSLLAYKGTPWNGLPQCGQNLGIPLLKLTISLHSLHFISNFGFSFVGFGVPQFEQNFPVFSVPHCGQVQVSVALVRFAGFVFLHLLLVCLRRLRKVVAIRIHAHTNAHKAAHSATFILPAASIPRAKEP